MRNASALSITSGSVLSTEQKAQRLVHDLPIIRNVALRPEKHSLRFGHRLDSHTVFMLRSDSVFFVSKTVPFDTSLFLSQYGVCIDYVDEPVFYLADIDRFI
jgi:hypothetical protein